MVNKFKIIALNANSIVSVQRRLNLLKFLEAHSPDCLLVNETKLNSRHKIEFKNYEMIRRDRVNAKQGGGTAILIKNGLKYKEIAPHEISNCVGIEIAIIKLKIQNTLNHLFLISIYCTGTPNEITEERFLEEWSKIFNILNLQNLNNYYIIAGDLNARHTNWGNATNNTRGNRLNRWMCENEMEYRAKIYTSDTPTMIRSGNFLDLAIADNRIQIQTNSRGEVPTHRYDSDHKAIEIVVREVGNLERGTNTVEGKRLWYNFTETNWVAWSEKLEEAHRQEIIAEEGEGRQGGENDPSTSSASASTSTTTIRTTLIPNTRNLDEDELQIYIDKITRLLLASIKDNEPAKQRRCNNMNCYTNPTIEKLYKHKSLLITKIKTYRRNLARNNNNNNNNQQQNRSEIQRQTIQRWKTEIKRTVQLIEQNVKMQIEKYWVNRMKNIKPGTKMWTEIKKMTKQQEAKDINVREIEVDERDINEYEQLNIPWAEMSRNNNNVNNNNNSSSSSKIQILDEQINLDIIGHHIEKHTRRNPALGKAEHERQVNETVEPIKRKHEQDKRLKRTKTQFSATQRAEAPEQPADDPHYFVTIEYLEQILKKANNKKSFGPDLIPNIIMKHLPNSIIIEICILFNQLLNNKSFPNCWKVARIFPILKKEKNAKDPESYRPISLLSNLGKIYEIIIADKIMEHVQRKELMPDNQFGFRHDHSTVHAITKLVSDVCHKLNFKHPTGAIMIDIKKAFESIWLDGLLTKLKQYNFNIELIEIIYELLYNRKFMVTTGGTNSTRHFKILNGVQQGTITAPILFNLYTAEMIGSEMLNSENIQTCAYADDMVLYSSKYLVTDIQVQLQKAVDYVQNYLHTWRIEMNAAKCEVILFRGPLLNANRELKRNWKKLQIKIDGQPVILKEMVKYLGINIDNMCYMAKHTTIQLEKARRAFMGARRLFYSKHITERVKIIAYMALIRPILTYGCPVWYNQVPRYMERMRVFERKCIRHCRGIHRKIDTDFKHYVSNKSHYENYESDRIDIHIITLVRNHIVRACQNTDNSLIYGPYNVDTALAEEYLRVGAVPGPNLFIHLDQRGYIQERRTGIPLIYHIQRRPNEKWFDKEKFENPREFLRYEMSMKEQQPGDYEAKCNKYWWLSSSSS